MLGILKFSRLKYYDIIILLESSLVMDKYHLFCLIVNITSFETH